MEAFAVLPFLFGFVIYLGAIGFSIWFAVSLIKAQKERNVLLKEISNKLDPTSFTKKD
jgi:hypothetical protein